MVWKVSKLGGFAKRLILISVSTLAVVCAFCTTTAADTVTPYDGNIGTTQLTYFRDALSNVPISDDYIFVRSGQYDYKLITGNIDFSGGVFSSSDTLTVYTLDTQTSTAYGSNYYKYAVDDMLGLYLDADDKLVYSNLGGYPQLETRSDMYAYLQTITVVILGLCAVVRYIFTCIRR